jgi:hypothetical protein
MAADASAYAALGLDPGADSATIEQAYKKLIKQHHPDREGGDAARAAEINRAYEQLRAERDLTDPLELNEDWPADLRSRGSWAVAVVVVAAAAALLIFLAQGPLAQVRAPVAALALGGRHETPKGVLDDPMDRPLNVRAIHAAAFSALSLSRGKDEMALASASRDCHRQLRSAPSLLELDRCAAFDDAVVQLQDRDPLRDQGPFSEIAVTGRILSAASALSDDSVSTDARLDRIRLQVELALAPVAQPVAPTTASD